MTDLRKAAEMALEALCSANPIGHALEDYEYHNKATETLRQALAQPEQEPVAWEKNYDLACTLLRQAHDILATTQYPIKRPWVSLTDEEIEKIQYSKDTEVEYELFDEGEYGMEINIYPEQFARAIEAALRSKNNG